MRESRFGMSKVSKPASIPVLVPTTHELTKAAVAYPSSFRNIAIGRHASVGWNAFSTTIELRSMPCWCG